MMKDLKKFCALTYGIYALAVVLQFSLQTMIVGMVALIVSTILLYRRRKLAAGDPMESHIHYLIRTFWIGNAVYLPILTLIAFAIIYFKIDFTAVQAAIDSGRDVNEENLMAMIMGQNRRLMMGVTLAFSTAFAVWWLYRCWYGYHFLRKDQPVKNVMGWL